MSLNKTFQSILWEYDLEKLNYTDDIVTQRVLTLWDKKETDDWINKLWKNRAKELFLKNSFALDRKSLNYWEIIFQVKSNLNNNNSMYDKLNTPIFSRSFR